MNVRQRSTRDIVYIYQSKCISIAFVHARVGSRPIIFKSGFRGSFHLLYDHLNLILLIQ